MPRVSFDEHISIKPRIRRERAASGPLEQGLRFHLGKVRKQLGSGGRLPLTIPPNLAVTCTREGVDIELLEGCPFERRRIALEVLGEHLEFALSPVSAETLSAAAWLAGHLLASHSRMRGISGGAQRRKCGHRAAAESYIDA